MYTSAAFSVGVILDALESRRRLSISPATRGSRKRPTGATRSVDPRVELFLSGPIEYAANHYCILTVQEMLADC